MCCFDSHYQVYVFSISQHSFFQRARTCSKQLVFSFHPCTLDLASFFRYSTVFSLGLCISSSFCITSYFHKFPHCSSLTLLKIHLCRLFVVLFITQDLLPYGYAIFIAYGSFCHIFQSFIYIEFCKSLFMSNITQ